MQLNGIPAKVTVDELQKVFLKNDKIINVEYFPKSPKRRESRTYLHFTDKESLRAFVNNLSSFYIHHGKHTLKWEIACGDSSLEKGAFDLVGVDSTPSSSSSSTVAAVAVADSAASSSSLSPPLDENNEDLTNKI